MRGIVLAVLLVLSAAVASAQQQPMVELTAGFHRIEAEAAANNAARMQGLMQRKSMPAQRGMLFVFEHRAGQCFWMMNTPLPLTAAFVADDGTIVNLADMKPHSLDTHCSIEPVRFVLEMNQGWFAKRGLGAGSRLRGPMFSGQR